VPYQYDPATGSTDLGEPDLLARRVLVRLVLDARRLARLLGPTDSEVGLLLQAARLVGLGERATGRVGLVSRRVRRVGVVRVDTAGDGRRASAGRQARVVLRVVVLGLQRVSAVRPARRHTCWASRAYAASLVVVWWPDAMPCVGATPLAWCAGAWFAEAVYAAGAACPRQSASRAAA